MSVGNEVCSVATIVFDVEDKVYLDLLVARWDVFVWSFIDEHFVAIYLVDLKVAGFFPLGIAILLIEFHGMIEVARDFETILVAGRCLI